jgi:hypothetical protein
VGSPATTSFALRTVEAIRYVTPLREGGSLPAVVEADDDGMYVLKFRGAGQGTKALAAEVIAGGLGRALGLPVPEIVLMTLDPTLGNAEPDVEIQELIAASAGLNMGMDFLPGALGFNPAAGRGHRLVRFPRHQRRPDAAQPQPAPVARSAVADRPRRGAVRPARLGPPG